MCNVYYHPEKHRLQIVDTIEYSSGCYEFDTRVVWYHSGTNKFYTARDSGCSCPEPFGDYQSIETLDKLNFNELRREVMSEVNSDRYNITMQEAQVF